MQTEQVKMAYIATDPKTNDTYAICSADPRFLQSAAEYVDEWQTEGAIVELLPADEAKERFCKSLHQEKQKSLF